MTRSYPPIAAKAEITRQPDMSFEIMIIRPAAREESDESFRALVMVFILIVENIVRLGGHGEMHYLYHPIEGGAIDLRDYKMNHLPEGVRNKIRAGTDTIDSTWLPKRDAKGESTRGIRLSMRVV